jgi:ribonuclease D
LFTFIDSIDDLSYLNQELINKPYLGIDTEFRRTTKDNMRLALLQVNDEEELYLIDSILIEDPGEHVSFLFSDSVVKILHSCKEDLEAIYSWTRKEMRNIFDTQVANSFLDGDFTIGYQGLVEQELGITLNKNETRSNWIRRPLSDSQLKYAALDVEYLIHLYKLQKEELSKTSKLDWLDQDIKKLLELTFNRRSHFVELERNISKAKEAEILFKFNKVIDEISDREKINKTLFFSKKAQKDFLRLVLWKGLDSACGEITLWRSQLIKDEIFNLLK